MAARARGAEAPGDAREVAPPRQEGPDRPRPSHPGKGRRQAPEVIREWPAEASRHAIEPLDVPLFVMAAAALAATILLLPRVNDRGGVLLAALLIYLAAATILVVASRWAMTSEERALRRAGEWPIMRRTPPSEGHMMVG